MANTNSTSPVREISTEHPGRINEFLWSCAGVNKAVLRLFKKFLSSYNSSSLCDKIEEKSSLMALLGEYIRIALPEDIMVKSVDDKRINEIIRFINSNLNKSLTLSELAKRFYLHPNHFIRFFKKYTGHAPTWYRRR